MGDLYVAPYLLLEPRLALVVEDDEGVAGFAVGTLDTAAWEDRLEVAWWPDLRLRYADPSDIPAGQRTPDQRRAWMIHHPARTPPAVAAPYPAHLHMNLLPRQQRRGMGRALLARWLALGAPPAVHVGVNRENGGAVAFWRTACFAPLVPDPQPGGRTQWMGHTQR